MDDKDIITIAEPRLTTGQRMYLSAVVKGMITTIRHFFSRKMTVRYPEARRPLYVKNHRAFHRLTRDSRGRIKCVACMMCETVCPARCIAIKAAPAPWPDREKYPETFVIDELRCIYCGMCEEACPVAAIELTPVFEPVSSTREEMMYDIDKLLVLFDATVEVKPYKEPKIVGYD
jgi:NADH-quinone oxidoreductase subunit I